MTVPAHLDEAVERSERARLRIEAAREAPASVQALRDWLDALTEYVFALSDVHRFGNESIHEKLHFLLSQARLAAFPDASPGPAGQP